MNNNNTINCPFCGRTHFILRKDGELRKTIFCRCKSKKYKYHNVINWVAGVGYQVMTEDLHFIDVV